MEQVEGDTSQIQEAIHWAGVFNKKMLYTIGDHCDHEGMEEMRNLLHEISAAALHHDRFDLLDSITKAMFPS